MNKLRNLQNSLDKIQFFFSRTTESFDDWDYEDEELKIFLNRNLIETYSNLDLKNLINTFI